MSEEEVVIDLSNVPLKPLGKKEIMQLEMALIIGTLYRPEVLELIRDPIERATWIDSLAVAAAALARYKAGQTVSQIAEELGRSEVTIRSHLNQKTKAGKLVAETFEKLRKGELKLILPFIKAPTVGVQEEINVLRAELEKLREEKKVLEEKIKELEEQLNLKTSELEALRSELNEYAQKLTSMKSEVEKITREKEELATKVNACTELFNGIKELAREILERVEKALKPG